MEKGAMEKKQSLKRFGKVEVKVKGEEIKGPARLDGDSKSWTRNRSMPLCDVIMCAIGRKALSGSMEIRQYFKEINESAVSKQDYFARRKKLNYKVFEELNRDYLKDAYETDETIMWNGYTVLAVDGSGVEISNSEENRKTFGFAKNNYGATVARASLSCMIDVFNQFILDIRVHEYKSSEIAAAKEQIEAVKSITEERPLLVIFDRGYPSIEFINFLEKSGISYLIRLSKTIYRKERNAMLSEDEDVEIEHTCGRIAALKKKNPAAALELVEKRFTKARIIETDIGKKKKWTFITNLPKTINGKDIANLYWKRWEIEKKFHTLKNKMKFESNTGKASIYVRQDFWSQVFVYNMVQDVIHSNDEEVKNKVETKEYKYGMRINENIAIGIFKEQFIQIMITDDNEKRRKMFRQMTDDMLKNLNPVRPDLPSSPRERVK
jgi:IS4 transposase